MKKAGYLQKMYKNIFAFLLAPSSNKMKMKKIRMKHKFF